MIHYFEGRIHLGKMLLNLRVLLIFVDLFCYRVHDWPQKWILLLLIFLHIILNIFQILLKAKELFRGVMMGNRYQRFRELALIHQLSGVLTYFFKDFYHLALLKLESLT